ncbi:phospholipase A-2-activating protein isoform X1 [Neodiprion virginianus]|uniref:phospholipase A-2-activating protein isoform X1 n=1 Tax=Neodiprion virginianus TaxID=2961670 RepID=UPI001EE6967F|nr:phospholipase A-2-activating protein isoform X1 [Neodiprion virginianus]
MEEAPYKLSSVLVGHSSDVRAVAAFKDGSLVSVSRDKTARLWRPNELNAGYTESAVLRGHSNFVSSVCVINPSEQFPDGFVITGSNDNNICIYLPGEENPLHTIKAHQNTVCNLTAGKEEGTFLSSSWDLTAKLWHINKLDSPQLTLTSHTAAVWCVADLANGVIVSGSADKLVIAWRRNGTILHKFSGHTDCVRGICVIKDEEFLSCANDATIRHWSVSLGTCLGTYCGHTNYVYGIASTFLLGGSHVVTSGEDRTVRIWHNAEIQQTLTLPAQSIWSVDILPNGDIVTGSSDGLVRIFSAKPERYADAATLQQYDEAVANTQLNAEQELGGIKISDLPDAKALHQPGQRDGQTKMIRDGNTVKAYSWSQSSKQWQHVGDVMGASGGSPATSGKQLYNGMEYDYVFSVDIQDGVPPLKLPYNNGDDPWCAAQKFIHDNNLSQLFLEQVANFIVNNSQSAPVLNAEPQFADPFTGGNRYIPGSGIPGRTLPNNVPTPSASSSSSSVSQTYIPHTTYLKLEQANVPAITEKLLEFNKKIDSGIHTVSEECLDPFVKRLCSQNGDEVGADPIEMLKIFLNWPNNLVFPALDLARLAVLRPDVNSQLCNDGLLAVLRRHIKTDALPANQMLAFRVLANMFCHSKGEALGLHYKDELLKTILDLSSLGSKHNQIAIASYLLNLIVALNKLDDTPGRTRVLNVMFAVLPLLTEPEAIFRGLVGLGTILAATPDPEDRDKLITAVRQCESALAVIKTMSECSTNSPAQNKLSNCSKQIIDLIM